MKKRLLVIAVALGCAIMLWLVGCLILSDDGKSGTLSPITNADTVYSDSLTAVAAAQNMVLTISRTQETTVGEDVFLEIEQQKLTYNGLGTDNMRAMLEETLTIDSHSARINEFFADGTGYVTVNDGSFSGSISAEDYQKRFAPAILLDASKYAAISGFDTGENYMIQFAEPTGVETWALDADSAFVDAKGTAYVSYDGQLTGSMYALTYDRGKARIRLTYIVNIALTDTMVTLPADLSAFRSVEYLDGPKMLERTTGYLLQADNVSAKYSDSIYCQAFGDSRTQEITLHTYTGDSWSALVETNSDLTNDSKIGQNTKLNIKELFLDGTYRSSTNGAEAIVNQDITADAMHTYCKNQLIGTVMLPQYITGARIVESENNLRIVFSASESFAPLISSNICQNLYQNPELLNDIAQSNTTNQLECYLELDSNTSLPIGSGIHYDGTFTVEGVPYVLRFQANQIYDVLSQSAQQEINKAGA